MNFLGTVLAGSAATITKSQEYPSNNFMLTGSAVRCRRVPHQRMLLP
jgi:hypothetical protein